MQSYNYYKNALTDIPKPCLFLDTELFEKNIQTILKASKGKKIRLASKSIRSISVIKKILNTSDTFQGVMCFSANEALYLNDNGLDDLLIAYPIWNSRDLKNIAERVANGQTITLMIDSIEHIEHLERIASEKKQAFLVCLDIDLSSDYPGLHFGVYRSPIKTTKQALKLLQRIVHSPYLKLDGIMGYEAQIAGITDTSPNTRVKNKIIKRLKKLSSKELMKKREKIIRLILKKNIHLRFINGGGTGSLHQTVKENVTEVTVGSGFFHSHLFDNYENYTNHPALAYAIEITRKPAKHIYTCLGGGYIASGAMGDDRLPIVHLPKGAKLIKNEGAGEVQTPVIYKGKTPLSLGDPIIMRHSKAGELTEHFHHIYLLEGGKVIDKYKTYRGDFQCFL